MRKTGVFGLALASLLAIGTVAQAQAQAATPGATQKHQARRARADAGMGRGLLRGITLTDAEKTKVNEVRAKYRDEAKTLRAQLRPSMQEARVARQKHDSAAAKAAWDKTTATRQQLQELATKQQADIRAALTPEHQTQFDANVKSMEERRAEMPKGKAHKTGMRPHAGARKG
jgi:Spy/CpxP family protein refolding chaperone